MTALANPNAADAQTAPRRNVADNTSGVSRLIGFAVALIVALQAHAVFNQSINWDEFFFYGQVADFVQGAGLKPMQTLHVHLFGWIPGVVSLGVDGVVIGRMFMLGCAIVSAVGVALVAGRFVSREHALVAALIWLTAGYTMQHGWSFRTDPLATAPMMAALAILTRARLSPLAILASGALVGAAGMVTLKSILLLPAFAGVAWLRWADSRFGLGQAIRIAAIPAVAAACFGAIYLWHSEALGANELTAGTSYAGEVGGSMLFAGLPIYLHFLVPAVLTSLPLVAVMAFALGRLKLRRRDEMIALIGLLLPLASLLIYRNTLPYFYPMMLAPVVAACAIGIAGLASRYSLRLVVIAATASGAAIWMTGFGSPIDRQRDLQRAAAEIFDEPVGYFDHADILPDFRKSNGFLTRWGIENAYARGQGEYRAALETQPVPLLLTAEPEHNPTMRAIMEDLQPQVRFHKADRELLRATYRRFWGPFWIAGTELSGGETATYEVMVPGPYTVTAGAIFIDGTQYREGSVLRLEHGEVALSNEGTGEAGIIWGDRLQRPDRAPPERPYWDGF